MSAISITNLHKSFKDVHAVQGLSLEVEEGDIYGFLGPNGAGKSTTMRVLATLLRPDSGYASVMGHDVVKEPEAVRALIGYMPDTTGAYRDMMVLEYLDFFAAAYGISGNKRGQVVEDCITLTGLEFKKRALIEGLSRGMRQRLGLARCLVNDPKVLILDEPASGLDPRARIEVQEILRTLSSMGKTVFISSHILSELRFMCNKIGILERGQMAYSGTITDALKQARTKFRLDIRLTAQEDEATEFLSAMPQVREAILGEDGISVELFEDTDDHSFVARALVEKGFGILSIKEEEMLLEDAFIKLTSAPVFEEPPEWSSGENQ